MFHAAASDYGRQQTGRFSRKRFPYKIQVLKRQHLARFCFLCGIGIEPRCVITGVSFNAEFSELRCITTVTLYSTRFNTLTTMSLNGSRQTVYLVGRCRSMACILFILTRMIFGPSKLCPVILFRILNPMSFSTTAGFLLIR